MLALDLTCILTRAMPRLRIRPYSHLANKNILIPKENLKTTSYLNKYKQERYYSNEPNQTNSEFSLPDGLLEYAQYQIQNPDEHLSNFGINNTLHNCLEELQTSLQDKKELQEMLTDPDMGKMAAKDIEQLDANMVNLVNQIKELLVPKEMYDEEDAIIEVVPGAGGLEANMFAEEIFNMYLAYVTYQGFSVGDVEKSMSIVGKQSKFSSTSGITQASAEISGMNVFGQLKYESGVHRVQRVPVTGTKSDRLQTSTCSVAILPKKRDLDMNIPEKDLKFEFMRSSGAGGQSVNTTDSACRVTYLPTGLVVKCQEERSQLQNKKKALEKIQKLLYHNEFDEMMGKLTSSRKLQIGNMNRNEKIRTYNFSRHMVTEHRLKLSKTFPNIVAYMSGDYGFQALEEFHDGLVEYDREEALNQLIQDFKHSTTSQ